MVAENGVLDHRLAEPHRLEKIPEVLAGSIPVGWGVVAGGLKYVLAPRGNIIPGVPLLLIIGLKVLGEAGALLLVPILSFILWLLFGYHA